MPEDPFKKFNAFNYYKLSFLMKEYKISVSTMCGLVGCGNTRIQRILDGEVSPRISEVMYFCHLFELDDIYELASKNFLDDPLPLLSKKTISELIYEKDCMKSKRKY